MLITHVWVVWEKVALENVSHVLHFISSGFFFFPWPTCDGLVHSLAAVSLSPP